MIDFRGLMDGHCGEDLAVADYELLFDIEIRLAAPEGMWKLEAAQTFREPGDVSWSAFAAGDTASARRLNRSNEVQYATRYRHLAELGVNIRRVRLVSWPLSSYLLWELDALCTRERAGAGVRVVDVELLAERRDPGAYPELVTVGNSSVFEVLYDQDGIHTGARRYTDRQLISQLREGIRDLYALGVSCSDFTRAHPLARL